MLLMTGKTAALLPRVACTISALWLGLEIYALVSPVPKFDSERRIAELASADPPIGSIVDFPELPQTGSLILVWVGDCTQCSKSTLNPEQWKSMESGERWVIFASTDTGSATNAERNTVRRIELTKDQKRWLNAYFGPRVYLLQNRRLTGIQKMGQDPIQFARTGV
jgi:hypothetical protein